MRFDVFDTLPYTPQVYTITSQIDQVRSVCLSVCMTGEILESI